MFEWKQRCHSCKSTESYSMFGDLKTHTRMLMHKIVYGFEFKGKKGKYNSTTQTKTFLDVYL